EVGGAMRGWGLRTADPLPVVGWCYGHHRVVRRGSRAPSPAESSPAGGQDRHIMMARRAYDQPNTALVHCRLSASHAGAYPNLKNQHRLRMRLCPPTHSRRPAIAVIAAVVIDHRWYWPLLPRSAGPSASIKSP